MLSERKKPREFLFGMTKLDVTSSFDDGVEELTEENHAWQSHGKATYFRKSGKGHIGWKRVPTTGPGYSRKKIVTKFQFSKKKKQQFVPYPD